MAYTLNLTTLGQNKLAAAMAGGPVVTLAEIGVGSGNGALLNPASTTLGAQVWRGPIIISQLTGTSYASTVVIPNTSGGWYIRELGLFDLTGNLIAYAQFPETYKPAPSGDFAGLSMTIRTTLVITNANTITTVNNPASPALADMSNVAASVRTRKISTVAAMSALVIGADALDGEMVQVKQHTSGLVGGGFFNYDAASTATVDGVLVYAAAGGVGRWHRIWDGVTLLDSWSGAIGDNPAIDDGPALFNLITVANATKNCIVQTRAKYYRSSVTLPITTRMAFLGANQSTRASVGDTASATTISCTTNNIPVMSCSANGAIIKGIHLKHENYQTSANTSAAGLRILSGCYFGYFGNLTFSNGEYPILHDSGVCFQNTFELIYIRGFSFTGIKFLGSTINQWRQIYVQNLIGPSLQTGVIQSIVRAGTLLTITLDAPPPNLRANFFFTLSGITQAAFNTMFVCKTLVGNVVTCDCASDPGFDPILGATPLLYFGAQVSAGAAVEFTAGITDVQGINIEHCITAGLLVNNRSESSNFTLVHLEACYSFGNNTLFRNGRGCTFIQAMSMYNMGVVPGQTLLTFLNEAGGFKIGNLYARDIAKNGATWNAAYNTTTPPQLDNHFADTSNRANSSGTPTSQTSLSSPNAINMPAYADNAAAVAAGLPIGRMYRTGDAVKIVHA